MFPVTLVHDKARRSGLEYLVIGGHAVNAYGIPRATLDVDFLACKDDRAAWKELLQAEGFRPFRDDENSPELQATFDRYGTPELYERSAEPSNPEPRLDALRDGSRAAEPDFELPIAPRWWSDAPRGTWESGYELSLRALESARNHPEIWEQRDAQRVNVEFVM